LTKACNMCEDRVAEGKMPMCVQHCQAWCMYYGEVEELVSQMKEGTRWTLLTK
ncbi:MAG: oxidoreductase, partial [Peptococcaceae bacterium]|nr:oxidoreductase [Peptococcaceae bacterium]